MVLFIYYLAVLGLRCSAGFSLVPASRCYSLVMVFRLLIGEPSLVAEHGLLSFQVSVVVTCGLSSHVSQAPEHRLSDCGTWALVQTCEIFLDKWLNQCPGAGRQTFYHRVLCFIDSWLHCKNDNLKMSVSVCMFLCVSLCVCCRCVVVSYLQMVSPN